MGWFLFLLHGFYDQRNVAFPCASYHDVLLPLHRAPGPIDQFENSKHVNQSKSFVCLLFDYLRYFFFIAMEK